MILCENISKYLFKISIRSQKYILDRKLLMFKNFPCLSIFLELSCFPPQFIRPVNYRYGSLFPRCGTNHHKNTQKHKNAIETQNTNTKHKKTVLTVILCCFSHKVRANFARRRKQNPQHSRLSQQVRFIKLKFYD